MRLTAARPKNISSSALPLYDHPKSLFHSRNFLSIRWICDEQTNSHDHLFAHMNLLFPLNSCMPRNPSLHSHHSKHETLDQGAGVVFKLPESWGQSLTADGFDQTFRQKQLTFPRHEKGMFVVLCVCVCAFVCMVK